MNALNSPPTALPAADWQPVVDALRAEAQEYGALLALFEEQQAHILARDSERILQVVARIDEQSAAARAGRRVREQQLNAFAARHGLPLTGALRALLPEFPAEVRPLAQALGEEINHLVRRLRRRGEQNRYLLQRTVDMNQQLLQLLRPESFTKTYSAYGRVSVANTAYAPSLQAAG